MSARSHAIAAPSDRAEELFRQHQEEIYRSTDRIFARLMLFQWVAAVVAALLISPQTWVGQTAYVHLHVWAAVFLGGAITLFPVWMTRAFPGSAPTRHVVACAQMLMSALLITISGGRIETHFHVFGSLVFLSFYRDWKVLIPATIIVALDHFIRGVYWPYSVYGVLNASPLRTLEHAAWVLFEDFFLVLACLRSVTEMRSIAKRTAALESSNHQNQVIMDNSQDVICTISEDGRFVTVSAACEQLWGYTPEELIGRPYIELVHPEDRAVTESVAAQLLAGHKITDFVNRYVCKDGQLVDVLWSVSWSAADRVVFCVAHDVTDRARIEKQLREAKEEADRANTAKSEFLSRMSHELRTPLNAILGFGQLIERQSDSTQRNRVGYILNAGRHLLNLINEVLDISRIEAGKLQLSLEPVRLADGVAEAVDLLRPLAAERQISLSVADDLEENCFVRGDRQRLKQVLLNLVTNAIKYTPAGGRVDVSYAHAAENVVRLNVCDTGRGIAADKLSRLFKPFDRLGAEDSAVEGTGLGLALCQRLVHAMQGTIGVNSSLGDGSTFWVELPAAESPLKAVPQTENGAAERSLQARDDRRRILYIEDNLSNLALLEQALAHRPDVQLMTAMQGRLGFELALQHSPDLILLDLHLPDLPGWEVLEKLRRHPATHLIPVVIISADATKRQIDRLLAAGARSYLPKPIDLSEFYRTIDETNCARSTECAAA
jgi:two-component system, sensor histidine kinase and response regulator